MESRDRGCGSRAWTFCSSLSRNTPRQLRTDSKNKFESNEAENKRNSVILLRTASGDDSHTIGAILEKRGSSKSVLANLVGLTFPFSVADSEGSRLPHFGAIAVAELGQAVYRLHDSRVATEVHRFTPFGVHPLGYGPSHLGLAFLAACFQSWRPLSLF